MSPLCRPLDKTPHEQLYTNQHNEKHEQNANFNQVFSIRVNDEIPRLSLDTGVLGIRGKIVSHAGGKVKRRGLLRFASPRSGEALPTPTSTRPLAGQRRGQAGRSCLLSVRRDRNDGAAGNWAAITRVLAALHVSRRRQGVRRVKEQARLTAVLPLPDLLFNKPGLFSSKSLCARARRLPLSGAERRGAARRNGGRGGETEN